MQYLLDIRVVSDLLRNPKGRITERICEVGDEHVCTSIIIATEVRFDMTERRSQRLSGQANTVLNSFQILRIEPPVDFTDADLRTSLESIGQPIGPKDLLIASHALALDLILVTNNVREFSRVEGLRVENWLRNVD